MQAEKLHVIASLTHKKGGRGQADAEIQRDAGSSWKLMEAYNLQMTLLMFLLIQLIGFLGVQKCSFCFVR